MEEETKRMLELAAVAAGISWQWDGWANAPMTLSPDGVDTVTWNPAASDGDSRRLQAATGISLSFIPGEIPTAVAKHQMLPKAFSARITGDAAAAAREAVLLAAAELGKMKLANGWKVVLHD